MATPGVWRGGVQKRKWPAGSRAVAIYRKRARGAGPVVPWSPRPRYRAAPARRGELKYFDTSITDAVITAAMTAVNIVLIPQNDTSTGRDGRKITVRSISIRNRYILEAPAAASNTHAILRIGVIQDSQTNGAAFTGANVLLNDDYVSPRNRENGSRFRWLAAKDIEMQSQGAVPSAAAGVWAEQAALWTHRIRCNIPIEYDNTAATGALTTQRGNSIWFAHWGQSAATLSSQGFARVCFTED